MTYVVTRPCLGTKDRSCVEVCPVDCFYDIKKKKYNSKYGILVDGEDGEDAVGLLVIHPDECINCGACETECPVEAIYEDSAVPEADKEFTEINEQETVSLGDEELDKLRCTSS
ncbi:ferredoxin family protein [bacterium]|nr:ferredoxin family protein [bacterium]